MRRKIISIISYTALGIIAIGVTIFLYWLYSPPKEAVSVSPDPIPVLTKTVKSDGTCAVLGYDRCVVLKFTRCKNVTATGRVVITLVNKTQLLTLPIADDKGDRKCDRDIQAPIPIPPIATPGEYHIHFRATYQINPLKSIIQEYDTESFNVE